MEEYVRCSCGNDQFYVMKDGSLICSECNNTVDPDEYWQEYEEKYKRKVGSFEEDS